MISDVASRIAVWIPLLMAGALALGIFVDATFAIAQRYTRDQAASDSLTKHLHKTRLPMVGAQVLDGDDGSVQVILFGFVATDKGRYDAEQRARSYLGNAEITVDNRVIVDPSVRRNQVESQPDADLYPPPAAFPSAAPSTSIFDAPPAPARLYPTPLPTAVPNLFAP